MTEVAEMWMTWYEPDNTERCEWNCVDPFLNDLSAADLIQWGKDHGIIGAAATDITIWHSKPTLTEAQAQKIAREAFKETRAAAVSRIKVTVGSGKTFDGDEVSQTRMARAIVVLENVGGTTPWVLADNTSAFVSVDELKEALLLSGHEQVKLWMESPPSQE